MQLGVCYYPEHWPDTQWPKDAKRMAALGIRVVRVGEFAWSRLEPSEGDYQFDWLQTAVDNLHVEGLRVVLGTPTTCPPRWLVEKMPDMLPVDEHGNVRKFGSRRHYCFSHAGYREACKTIVTMLAQRFGEHPAVIAWQTDNEYGCHDTTLSYSHAAKRAFQQWLKEKYKNIDALNKSWGNVFWSMEYNAFAQINLPNQTVTEANPAHHMDFHRFSSDQVVSFNRLQTDIIRKHAPGRDVIHNFMGRVLDFDHHKVGADLDISSWDSYPLGFLQDRSSRDEAFKKRYMRRGDPDFQAMHHDLYRSTSNGRWWVMEQQPGPVNWANFNPAPAPGMVRFWTWEAIAHGAECVSYFRWRQAPFGQEQMHAGLLRSDGEPAQAFQEAKQVAGELAQLDLPSSATGDVAIVFDYESAWAWRTQPQGEGFDYFDLVFDWYKGLRQLGLSIDFLSANCEGFGDHALVCIPGLFAWTASLRSAIQNYKGRLLIGPRTGSKTKDFSIPDSLPPDLPNEWPDLKVTHVETLRPDSALAVTDGGSVKLWREFLSFADEEISISTADGEAVLLRRDNQYYLAGWPDAELMKRVLDHVLIDTGLNTTRLPEDLRMRRLGDWMFVFNHGETVSNLDEIQLAGKSIFGTPEIASGSFAIMALTR